MAEENQSYAKLGGKTLFILILKRSPLILLPIILLVVAIVARLYIPSLITTSITPLNYTGYVNVALLVVVIILAATIFLILFTGWLEYLRYKIFIDWQSIKINKGIIREEQIGIPFRRIKEAAIVRGIFDQLFGLSKLVLTVSGEDEEEGDNHSDKSKIVLPALDKDIAIAIQDVVLEKAQVEEMNIQRK
jgi:uncharacterized membrane protein YdbT with pleckstrin-like domain